MSARGRVVALTLIAAAAFAAVVVLVASRPDDSHEAAPAGAQGVEQEGSPPVSLDLGFRLDAEAEDLRRAQRLHNAGEPAAARRLFDRYDSLEAKVGSALARWPEGSVDRLLQLGGLFPGSGAAQLHLGLALFWAGRPGADDAWRAARDAEPDSLYAITAEDLLFPGFARGRPVFQTATTVPERIASLPPARQLDALRRAAEGGDAGDLLLYGVALQRGARPVSARRVFERAARSFPGDPESQVASAVGRFDKERPEEAFSRLGPLTRRFPESASVRFHIGLLLLWSGEVEEAVEQLRQAQEAEPGSPLAREAGRYLERIEAARNP